MSLADHLNAMGLRRELAELLAKTDGLRRILAHSDAGDVRAQADLDGLIDLHRVFEHYLKAAIELQEMGNIQGSRNAEAPDRWERRRMLEADAKEWDDSMERWKQEYRTVAGRLESREKDRAVQSNSATPERTDWSDTQVQLAAHIVNLLERGEIKAPNKRQAVLRNADRWILVDDKGHRKRVNPESAWRTYDLQTRS